MKIATLSLAVFLLTLPAAFAQAKAPAAPAEKPLQLAPEPAPTDFLIPDNIPQNPKPRGSAIPQPSSSRSSSSSSSSAPARPKTNKTTAAEEDVKQRIQYRLAKNKAVRDPAVLAALEAAEKAKTDLEKREAMKRYYALLNARILKIDGSLSKSATERKTYSTRRLDQTRIDPTEPLDPDERTERQGRD